MKRMMKTRGDLGHAGQIVTLRSNVAHFRIDKMTDVHILPEKIKPMSKIPELAKGLDLPKHMAEHIYMFSGETVAVKIKTTADMMTELVDWFGTDFRILEESGDTIVVRVKCNYSAMRYWALQYGPYAEIIEPESLRRQLQDDIAAMAEKYSNRS